MSQCDTAMKLKPAHCETHQLNKKLQLDRTSKSD